MMLPQLITINKSMLILVDAQRFFFVYGVLKLFCKFNAIIFISVIIMSDGSVKCLFCEKKTPEKNLIKVCSRNFKKINNPVINN